MKYLFATGIAVLTLALVMGENNAGEKAKFTIPQVMAKAHKSKLMNKVATGDASADEKKQLVELYTALSKNEPPAGEASDWKKKTDALVTAAKKAADGNEPAAKSLLKLANCKACHDAHKG